MKKSKKKSASTSSSASKLFKVEAPAKRKSILYCRVKELNTDWVTKQAALAGVSESLFMDQFLDHARKK